MEKDKLRNILFEKYFELEDGINIKDLIDNISYIPKIYEELDQILAENIKDYNAYNKLEIIKNIKHNNREYLIIKIRFLKYIIIDLSNNKALTLEEVKVNFNKEFFITNFKEIEGINIDRYYILEDIKNIKHITNFYFNHKEDLNIKTNIFYKITYNEAISYISINLSKGNIQLGFQTEDQFLYEQLFFNIDLTPSIMQDSIKKIGINKTNEIFSRIKDINIPFECIPKEIHPNNSKKLIKKKHSK